MEEKEDIIYDLGSECAGSEQEREYGDASMISEGAGQSGDVPTLEGEDSDSSADEDSCTDDDSSAEDDNLLTDGHAGNSSEPEEESAADGAYKEDVAGSSDSGAGEGVVGNELARMVEKMGAATVLEILKDNRNAAIRQIISEVEASGRQALPSGGAESARCRSIFDLAALAHG